MDKRISEILNDLFQIDPQFKAHEHELRNLVSELILSKPDTHFDESFAAKLRAELLETKVKPTPSPYTTFFMSRMFYGIVGSALTILVVVPFTFIATQKATSPDKPVVLNPFSDQVKDVSTALTPQQQISNKGMNAFGKLALVPTTENSEAPATVGTMSTSAATGPVSASASSPTAKASLAPQVKTNADITYTYTGNAISLTETQGKVFKRTKGAESGKQLFDMVQKGKFGLTDLNSFSDLHLKDVQLSQDKPFGYVVGINLDEGAISITPQNEYWNIGNSTTSVATATPLDAASLISIAEDFMKSHGITTTVYAQPVAIEQSSLVIYPLKIEDKVVSEQDGSPFGLVVSIDPVQKKVSTVSNLTSQTYDSSLYTLETNFETIIQVATSSLMHPGKTSASAQTATLGTPQQVLMHYWITDEKTGVTNELFIPALSFPITYNSKTEGSPSTIVVPLVKDFLAKALSSTKKHS